MKRSLIAILILCLWTPPLHAKSLKEDYLSRSEKAEQWFFKELPHHLGEDFKEGFSDKWHLLGLAAGSGLAIGIGEVDSEIQGKFHPNDPLGASKDVFKWIGNSFVLGGATFIALATSKVLKHEKATLTAGTMLESLFLTYSLTYALKFTTHRLRPDGSDSLSFPSGHASGAFALATVTEVLYGPLFGIPSYALAGMISISRLDSNKHVASDVAAGALLGTVIGLGTAKFHKKERGDLFLTPAVVSSGGGFNVTGTFQ
jgi:membrane-associated phospholipid phosphatase